MPSSFNVLLQTKAHPKIIMLFGLATKKSAQKVYRQKASTTKTTVHCSDGKSKIQLHTYVQCFQPAMSSWKRTFFCLENQI